MNGRLRRRRRGVWRCKFRSDSFRVHISRHEFSPTFAASEPRRDQVKTMFRSTGRIGVPLHCGGNRSLLPDEKEFLASVAVGVVFIVSLIVSSIVFLGNRFASTATCPIRQLASDLGYLAFPYTCSILKVSKTDRPFLPSIKLVRAVGPRDICSIVVTQGIPRRPTSSE